MANEIDALPHLRKERNFNVIGRAEIQLKRYVFDLMKIN